MSDMIQVLSKIAEAQRRSAFNPIEGLTPERLASQLTQFRAGTLRDLSLTMDAIEERDDVLASVVPKAKSAVARHGYEINVVEEIPNGMEELAQKQKSALKYFYDHLRAENAMEGDEVGEFSLLLRQMMDAKGKRYSAHHIVWKSDGPGLYSARLIHVPLWFFEARTGRLRFIQDPYGYDGVALEEGAWMVSVGQGLMRACSVAWMFKRLSLNDWVSYCDKHGFPGIHAKTDAAKGSPEWDDLVQAVADFSSDWATVTNRAADINLIEAKGAGQIPYPPLVERMDRALSTIWRGNDLSTMSAGSGQGQGASLQGGESDILEHDDACWASEQLRLKLDRFVLSYIFGEDVPALAYITVLTSPKDNVDEDLKIDAVALANGHPISQRQFAERYNRPIPPPEDTLLKAPAAPLQTFGNPAAPLNPAVNDRRRMTSASDTAFKSSAASKLNKAQAAALAPLRDRLTQVLAIDDEAKQTAALTRFKAALPEFLGTMTKDKGVQDALVEIFGTALVSGAAEGAAAKQN